LSTETVGWLIAMGCIAIAVVVVSLIERSERRMP